MIVEVAIGSAAAVTIAALRFARWVIAHEEDVKESQEIKNLRHALAHAREAWESTNSHSEQAAWRARVTQLEDRIQKLLERGRT